MAHWSQSTRGLILWIDIIDYRNIILLFIRNLEKIMFKKGKVTVYTLNFH